MISRDHDVGEIVIFVFFLLGMVCINQVYLRFSEWESDNDQGAFHCGALSIWSVSLLSINVWRLYSEREGEKNGFRNLSPRALGFASAA